MVSILLFWGFLGQAQQNRFVFIQSQPGMPFYVRMGDKTLSSTSFGGLVIAPLKDSVYRLYIGLPKNQAPEQEFVLEIKGSDRGFELKRSTENRLRLYEWQKMLFLDPVSQPGKVLEQAGSLKTDGYSRLMAGVVDDPAVAMNTVIKTSPASATKSEQMPVQAKDSVHATVTTLKAGGQGASPDSLVKAFASDEPLYKVKDSNSIEGSVYIKDSAHGQNSAARVEKDNAVAPKDTLLSTGDITSKKVDSAIKTGSSNMAIDNKRDTVAVQPLQTRHDSAQAMAHTEKESIKPNIQKFTELTSGGYRKLVFIDRTSNNADTVNIDIPVDETAGGNPGGSISDRSDSSEQKGAVSGRGDSSLKASMQNSDCVKFASDADVDRLRVLMLKESNDDDRIFQARKAFKTRCFTTRQVKGLSELFPSDEGRYKFLDAAYPFVSDSGNFRSLLELLSDPYYINRFKAMVRLQD